MARPPGTSTTRAGCFLRNLVAGNSVNKAVLFSLPGRPITVHALDDQSPRHGPSVASAIRTSVDATPASRSACIDAAEIDPHDRGHWQRRPWQRALSRGRSGRAGAWQSVSRQAPGRNGGTSIPTRSMSSTCGRGPPFSRARRSKPMTRAAADPSALSPQHSGPSGASRQPAIRPESVEPGRVAGS